MNKEGYSTLTKLEEIAQQLGATMAQAAIAWVLANPTVTSAIVGANSPDQLANSIKGTEVSFTADEKQALDEITIWT
jgi:aryl-alcohol dehydrogenase-like predicted oxidoreductase